jgi:hypothetical protein
LVGGSRDIPYLSESQARTLDLLQAAVALPSQGGGLE